MIEREVHENVIKSTTSASSILTTAARLCLMINPIPHGLWYDVITSAILLVEIQELTPKTKILTLQLVSVLNMKY